MTDKTIETEFDDHDLDDATEVVHADAERDDWDLDEDDEELPPRPRNRFREPLSIGLIMLLIASLGFFAGIELQKSKGSDSAGASPFGDGGAPAALAGGSFPGAETSAAGGAASGSDSASTVTGAVTGVKGKTIYVKNSEGTVLAVRVGAGATVIRTAKSEASAVHPGDTVVVEGSRNGAKATAGSVEATAAGVETRSGMGGFPSGATAAGSETSEGEGEAESGVDSLFE